MTWAAFRNSPFAHPTLRETGWEWDRGQEQEWGQSQSDNCSALSGGAAGRGVRRLVLGALPSLGRPGASARLVLGGACQFGTSRGGWASRSGDLVPVSDVPRPAYVSFWVASSSLGQQLWSFCVRIEIKYLSFVFDYFFSLSPPRLSAETQYYASYMQVCCMLCSDRSR